MDVLDVSAMAVIVQPSIVMLDRVLKSEVNVSPAMAIEADTAPPSGDRSDESINMPEGQLEATAAPSTEAAEAVDESAEQPRRKKHRRGKSRKRRWKPYNKLTWDEKKALEDRESLRALRIRAEMFAHGQPVAPYNTTQFLMEDHNVQEPLLENIPTTSSHHHRQHKDSNCTVDDSDEFYSSPEDEEEFLQKEFTEAYDNIHAERLNTMGKSELIQEYIQLEDRVDKLEQKLRHAQRDHENRIVDPGNFEECWEKARIFQEEICKLQDENARLREENELLRNGLARRDCSDG